MTQHTVLWSVSLSNGETLYEEKGAFQTIRGELSPWQRLLKYLSETNTVITSLSLYTKEGRRFNLPSNGANPKFKEFGLHVKPVFYKMFRKIGFDAQGGNRDVQDVYTVAEATYEDGKVLQVWVDNATHNCWTVIA